MGNQDTPTFRDLLDAARKKGRTAFQSPRPMSEIAEMTQISRVHLYNLMTGRKTAAKASTVAFIAQGLGLSRVKVQAALDRTRELAEVMS